MRLFLSINGRLGEIVTRTMLIGMLHIGSGLYLINSMTKKNV